MAKWAHADVLDNGPVYLKTECTDILLLKAYADGDDWTAVNTTNKIASAAFISTNFSGPADSTGDRVLTATTNGVSATASANSGAGPDLHIAFVDTAATKVLWVTDETSNQVITSGNTVNFPSGNLTYTVSQPV